MSAPVHMQTDALRVLARSLKPHLMVKSGMVGRETEAVHLIEMLKDAVDTLECIERGEFAR